jgi:glycosyltransferase involved in cell wall biosynthesis
MAAERRLLTIGHSYVVGENRRLADAIARSGAGRWHVTAIAPARFRGDFGPIDLVRGADEACEVRATAVRFDRSPHLMWYAGLDRAVAGRWDVVHCWEEPYVHAAAQVASAIGGRPRFVVSTFQNLSKHYPWPLSRFERTTMRRANAWIAFGETVRSALAGRPGYGVPARTIPPGVDVTRFRPWPEAGHETRRALGWADDDYVVGYLGRFVEQKGLTVLTDALERLPGPWRALFVGGGPLEAGLRGFAGRHGDRVRIETGVAHADVPRWLNAMSVLCAPSLTTARWREQFGRMLIEAMACGVPVIGSDSGEIPHVIGDAGVVVREGDAAELAAHLQRLREDDGTRSRFARAGRDRACARFAWPVVARAHLDLFESLC